MPKVNEIKQMSTSDKLWWVLMYVVNYGGWALFLWFLVNVVGFEFKVGS